MNKIPAVLATFALLSIAAHAHADEVSSAGAEMTTGAGDASFVLSSDYSIARRADAPGLYRADISTALQAVSSRLPGAGIEGDLRGYIGLGHGLSADLQAQYVDLQSKVLPTLGAHWAFYTATIEGESTATATLAWAADVGSNLLQDGSTAARIETGLLGTFRKERRESSFNLLGGLTPDQSMGDLRLRAASGYNVRSDLMIGGETDSVWAWGSSTGDFGQQLNVFFGGLAQFRYQRVLISASAGMKYLGQNFVVDGQTEAQGNLRVGVGL
jgi:hypothetical protein